MQCCYDFCSFASGPIATSACAQTCAGNLILLEGRGDFLCGKTQVARSLDSEEPQKFILPRAGWQR